LRVRDIGMIEGEIARVLRWIEEEGQPEPDGQQVADLVQAAMSDVTTAAVIETLAASSLFTAIGCNGERTYWATVYTYSQGVRA